VGCMAPDHGRWSMAMSYTLTHTGWPIWPESSTCRLPHAINGHAWAGCTAAKWPVRQVAGPSGQTLTHWSASTSGVPTNASGPNPVTRRR
jgi:hypothetical protein